MTIREVLSSAFLFLFELEQEMNGMYEKMAGADEEEMAHYMEETGVIQELLLAHDFYMIDSKVEEVARTLGLAAFGLESSWFAMNRNFMTDRRRRFGIAADGQRDDKKEYRIRHTKRQHFGMLPFV